MQDTAFIVGLPWEHRRYHLLHLIPLYLALALSKSYGHCRSDTGDVSVSIKLTLLFGDIVSIIFVSTVASETTGV